MPVAGPTRVMNIIISGATCIKASAARAVLVNALFQEIHPDPFVADWNQTNPRKGQMHTCAGAPSDRKNKVNPPGTDAVNCI